MYCKGQMACVWTVGTFFFKEGGRERKGNGELMGGASIEAQKEEWTGHPEEQRNDPESIKKKKKKEKRTVLRKKYHQGTTLWDSVERCCESCASLQNSLKRKHHCYWFLSCPQIKKTVAMQSAICKEKKCVRRERKWVYTREKLEEKNNHAIMWEKQLYRVTETTLAAER